MEDINWEFRYTLDFSQDRRFDKEKIKDDAFDDLLKEVLKSMEKCYKSLKLDYQKVEKFYVVKEYLQCIAIENFAVMSIRVIFDSSRICIELESEILDFNIDKIKNMFIETLKTSEFVCFETRPNSKIGLIVEISVYDT